MSGQQSANHSRRGSRESIDADSLSSSRVERVPSNLRRSSQSHKQPISSADHIITVSPGAKTPPRRQSGFIPQQPTAGDAAADIEAGLSSRQQSRRSSNSSNTGVGRLQALLQLQQAATQPDAAAADLVQPLLPPDEPPAQQDSAAAAGPSGEAPAVPPTPASYDPFPATTAARAAAAEVARARSAAAGGPRAALLARSASAAAAAAAAKSSAAARFQQQLAFASGLSWIVNILLLGAKLYAYWLSQSKAVLASAADSAVDLVSQVVISYADWRVRREDPRFPVGQARLEAIGVLACACIMSVASFEVIQESVSVLLAAYTTGQLPRLELGLLMYLVLGAATLLKLLCWAVCAALQGRSDSMLALAEDHLNDIMSNTCAIITAVAAGLVPRGWWIDPAGAIAISLYIVVRWLAIAKQQVDKIIGRGAPAEFVGQLESLANSHHQDMGLDCMRAYHFGARYIVEMEVVLPADMTVQESHDISLELQHKVEQLEEVERAFVHVDYTKRDGLEHKVERELAIARALSTSSSGRLTPGLEGGSGSGALASKDSCP